MALSALEFFAWVNRPENGDKRWELVKGEPVELPAWQSSFHADHMKIAGLLADYVIQTKRGSVAFMGDGVITKREPDTIRCPAVMVFLGPPPNDFPPHFTTEVPDLIVELHPPGESYGRIMRRIVEYVNFGVKLVWGVEPDEREMSVYVPKSAPTPSTRPTN